MGKYLYMILLRSNKVLGYQTAIFDCVTGQVLINSLPMKIRVKAFASLKILSEYGNNLREPYSKYIDKGIFELRIKFSTDITRIFYFFIKDNKIILTNGYIKKQNKLDSNEFIKAVKYKEDYERREKR
jgi:phage-related protein